MDLPHPTWLRTFEAASKHGNFSKAALELGLTPAAVSQQMRLLEKHLNTTLFERLPRGVALTDMGEAYAQAVRKSLSDMQTATIGLFGAGKKRQIKVRASISFAVLVIAPRLHEFLFSHPHIDVELSTFVWAGRFQEGLSDLDIRYGHGDWADGQVSPLGHEFGVPVCHKNYMAQFGHSATMEQLASDHIITIHGSESDWPQLFEQMQMNMPIAKRATHLDSSLLALQAVSTGNGIAIVLERFARSYLAGDEIVNPTNERIAIRPSHYLVERAGTELREDVQAFSNWIKAIYLESSLAIKSPTTSSASFRGDEIAIEVTRPLS